LALDGREATEPDAFRWRILTAAKQVSLQIERGQPAERKSLSLSLDGSPLRIGVSWRLDSAEPDTAVIVEVVPGSAADEAGLQVGDRIYGVGGRPLGNPLQLGEQLTTATLPLILMIERHGQLRSVKLHVQ